MKMNEYFRKKAAEGFEEGMPMEFFALYSLPIVSVGLKLKESGYNVEGKADPVQLKKYGVIKFELDRELERINMKEFSDLGIEEIRLAGTESAKEWDEYVPDVEPGD